MKVRELFLSLVKVCPAFSFYVEEHLKDNDQELLPHLLMADLLRFVETFFIVKDLNSSALLTRQELKDILKILEDAIQKKDEETKNVIAVSFLEHLWLEPYFLDLKPMLGTALCDEIKRQRELENGKTKMI